MGSVTAMARPSVFDEGGKDEKGGRERGRLGAGGFARCRLVRLRCVWLGSVTAMARPSVGFELEREGGRGRIRRQELEVCFE